MLFFTCFVDSFTVICQIKKAPASVIIFNNVLHEGCP